MPILHSNDKTGYMSVFLTKFPFGRNNLKKKKKIHLSHPNNEKLCICKITFGITSHQRKTNHSFWSNKYHYSWTVSWLSTFRCVISNEPLSHDGARAKLFDITQKCLSNKSIFQQYFHNEKYFSFGWLQQFKNTLKTFKKI